jgi:hypothetical protein
MATVTISLQSGTVVCTPDKGNVWAKNPGPKDPDRVKWVRASGVLNFRLDFYKKPMQGHVTRPDWPFEGQAPEPPNSTGVVGQFEAAVGEEIGVYEYTIQVNVASTSPDAPPAFLDPMLIVGRG